MQCFDEKYSSDSQQAISLALDTGWLMASELIACGVDISFAPILDVDKDFSSIIGDRAFSNQPQRVIELAGAFIDGMHEAGMAATGKHFPGHGGVEADSHLELPVDNRSWLDLVERDFIPFKGLSDKLDGVMPAHIVFPEVDNYSVGFSSKWLQQILRKEFAFDGVIFSDDLTMEGASAIGDYPQRAFAALDAGCDVILICNNRAAVLEVIHSLEDSNLKNSTSNIGLMRAKSLCEFSNLIESQRYLATKAALETL